LTPAEPPEHFEHQVVISGIGMSQYGRRLGRSDIDLTLEACRVAVADAGLELADIDGISTWPGEWPAASGFNGPGIVRIHDALGLDLSWHQGTVEGPGQGTAVMAAMMAVACGLARHVLVYRTTAEATGQGGGGRSGAHPWDTNGIIGPYQWVRPFGSVTAATWLAPHFQRYLYDYGIEKSQVGWLPVTQRAHAIARGTAAYPEPLTIDDYLASRMIATPLQLFDCDIPMDGSVAFVVSPAAYGKDAPHPVRVDAIGTALDVRSFWDQWTDPTANPQRSVGKQVWTRTSLTPADVDVAELYDGFTFLTLIWLESLGFCAPGEAAAFVDGGTRITLGGELPLNTAGGQLSHGRFHGYGHFHEACVQLRGQGGATQVPGAEVAAVGFGGGIIAGSFLLTRWRS
jgi:acetyl-CoA acetyltransferase